MIRVAVVDDHPLVREGTAALIDRTEDMEVAGVAASLDELRPILADDAVDVLLLDLRLGDESGFDLLRGKTDAPLPAIVVVTSYDYPQYADAALRLGAAGFVVKTAPTAELLDAIRRAAAGGIAFGVRPGGVVLSKREREVVRLVVEGSSNDEIGAALGISSRTVESHLRRLFERLDAASRTELAARALREGWLEEIG